MSTNDTYRTLLSALLDSPQTAEPRGMKTHEYLGWQTKIDMRYPVITIPSRKLNYRFMAAEAYWILTGQSGLTELAPYCARMADFSDDGINLSGAYGPRFVSQVRYVVDALVSDPLSRQAVMTLWERNPRASKDIPCTVSLQWLLRENKLHCIAYMRSSDAWLGIPYDIFSFTMMTCYIAMSLHKDIVFPLGTLRIMAGSQHLYYRNDDAAREVSTSDPKNDGAIQAISLHGLNTPDDILNALGDIRNASNDQVLQRFQGELCHVPQ